MPDIRRSKTWRSSGLMREPGELNQAVEVIESGPKLSRVELGVIVERVERIEFDGDFLPRERFRWM